MAISADRNPLIREQLEGARRQGHRHVRFITHSEACEVCRRKQGSVKRISTLLKQAHFLPHPNCRCSWEPAGRVTKGPHVHTLSKGTTLADKAGLHKERVTTKTGDTVTRWVRDEPKAKEEEKPPKEPTKDSASESAAKTDKKTVAKDVDTKPSSKTAISKISEDGRKNLNETVNALRKIEPGKKSTIGGQVVERHPSQPVFRLAGKIMLHGFRAASLALAGLEKVTATVGQTATGSLAAGRELASGTDLSRGAAAIGVKSQVKIEQLSQKVQDRYNKAVAEFKAAEKEALEEAKKQEKSKKAEESSGKEESK